MADAGRWTARQGSAVVACGLVCVLNLQRFAQSLLQTLLQHLDSNALDLPHALPLQAVQQSHLTQDESGVNMTAIGRIKRHAPL